MMESTQEPPAAPENIHLNNSEESEYYCIAEFDLDGLKEIEELISGSNTFELLVCFFVFAFPYFFLLGYRHRQSSTKVSLFLFYFMVSPFFLSRIGGKAFLGTPDEAMGTYLIFRDNNGDSIDGIDNCDFFATANKSLIFHPVKLDEQSNSRNE